MNVVKKIIIFILCIQVVMPNVLHHLFYLPALISHYSHHHHHEDMAFTEFMQLHYADKSHHNSDKEHKDLPFQNNDNCLASGLGLFLPPNQILTASRNFQHSDNSIIKLYPKSHNFHDSKILDNIWQPPKFSIV